MVLWAYLNKFTNKEVSDSNSEFRIQILGKPDKFIQHSETAEVSNVSVHFINKSSKRTVHFLGKQTCYRDAPISF